MRRADEIGSRERAAAIRQADPLLEAFRGELVRHLSERLSVPEQAVIARLGAWALDPSSARDPSLVLDHASRPP